REDRSQRRGHPGIQPRQQLDRGEGLEAAAVPSMSLGRLPRSAQAAVRFLLCSLLGVLGTVLSDGAALWAQESAPDQEIAAAPAPGLLGPEELRKLVAPVALYPDDLLAIVLPASTLPVQIVEAQRFLEKHKKDEKLQPNAEWDPAVLALLNYPEVIAKMNAD